MVLEKSIFQVKNSVDLIIMNVSTKHCFVKCRHVGVCVCGVGDCVYVCGRLGACMCVWGCVLVWACACVSV